MHGLDAGIRGNHDHWIRFRVLNHYLPCAATEAILYSCMYHRINQVKQMKNFPDQFV